MSKITADHLARSAYVYVRQSTPGQVHRNHESRRRQYGLAERAKQSKPHGSRAMVVTGTRCWNSAVWSIV